ncbi:MAG: formylglycine-generating enzyme family protein [Desulfamplus sp.]|nr:formylglycine-generating enzyme family protein [Desulfamplus sp.]
MKKSVVVCLTVISIVCSYFVNAEAFNGFNNCIEKEISNASISIDGNFNDWNAVTSFISDPSGDSDNTMTGDDIKAVYFAKDDSNIFIKVDLWENLNTSFWNYPPPNDGRYNVSINNIYVGIAYNSSSGKWEIGYNGSGGPSGLKGSSYVVTSSQSIELKIPFSYLDTSSEFKVVVNSSKNYPTGTTLDESQCVLIGDGTQNSATVVTGTPATSITSTTATLNGTVNPNGSATTYYFDYGTTTNYGSKTTSQNAGSGTSNVSVTADLTGLVANTTYHFRLVATNSKGTTYGSDYTFKTTEQIVLGRLQVTLSPTDAITAGAKWRVDSGEWQNSGATVSNLTAGTHTVDFKDITGWTKPDKTTIDIQAGQTATLTKEYIYIECSKLQPPSGITTIEMTSNPTDAPVYMGSVVTGGNQMELSINFPAYSKPVDIWIAIRLPDGSYYVVDESGKFLPSTSAFAPVASGVACVNITKQLVPPFETSTLGTAFNGLWFVYWLIAPESNGDFAKAMGNGKFVYGSYSFEVAVKAKTFTNSLKMTFNLIPAGTFMMGSPADELGRFLNSITSGITSHESPQHKVTLTKAYYMQTTEVTQGQWKAIMGSNPSRFSSCGDNCPVEQVSWDDIQEFITKLNAMGQETYELPTEAQWEYAARAGSTTAFSNGGMTDPECDDANLDAIGWYCGNSLYETKQVAQKIPNAWGLYDMHGNVMEFCQDWYASYSTFDAIDPVGPAWSMGLGTVIRGGSWIADAIYCRSALRANIYSSNRSNGVGFRLVCSAGHQ